jgi:hypothetical protein
MFWSTVIKDIEAGSFGGVQKLTVLQSRHIGESGGLAVVAWKEAAIARQRTRRSKAASTTRQQ